MSVTILRPSAVLSPNTYSAPVAPPIGPAYLAASLKTSGLEIHIIDAVGEAINNIVPSKCGRYNLQGLSHDEIIQKINNNVKIIGVSIMFSLEWPVQRDLINKIKKKFPLVSVVLGGEHPSALPEYSLRDCVGVNFVVLGEGEETFVDLCTNILSEDMEAANKTAGVAYLDCNGGYVQNSARPRIRNITNIPYPAWELVPVENYMIGNWTMGISYGRNMPIVATRGCPYQCTFCSNPTMWTTRYVMRDPKDVVNEIKFLIKNYQINCVDFYDLTAIVKKQWILEFCKELKSNKLEIAWQLPSGTRSEALDYEVLKELKETGLKYLVYAPESGSEEVLQLIKKKVKLNRLIASIVSAVELGHIVKVNLIIGFPSESLSNCLKTLLFMVRMGWIGVADCNMAVFSPYPGSELYSEGLKSGKIETPSDNYFFSLMAQFDMTSNIGFSEKVKPRTLILIRLIGHSLFYIIAYLKYPSRLLNLLKNASKNEALHYNLFEQRISDFIMRKKLNDVKK
jgi:anaerobic magnesium-protoporphyrin IX monomethyl ester cyclase